MKVEWEGGHPDEGSINALLDGELDASESALLDEHVRGCTECGARVGEARGFIAGASRVVGQLDATPARLIQPATTPTLGDSGSMWRLMRVTPTRASIAAVVLVALGITLTRTRVAKDSEIVPAVAIAQKADTGMMTAMAAPREAPVPMKDGVLESAIARKLAGEHPARTVERAPGPDIPRPDSIVASATVANLDAPQRVAAAKVSLRSSRDSSSPPADKSRVGFSSGSAVAADRVANAGAAAEAAGLRNELSGRVAGIVVVPPTAGQCYLVDSGTPGAQWGTVTLPMVVAFDSVGTTARVLTTGGVDTEMRAVRMTGHPDSLVLRLRRIGYSGTLALSGASDARTGVMRSSQLNTQLSEVVTAGVAEQRAAAQGDTRKPPRAAPAAPQPVQKKVEAPAQAAEPSVGRAVAITAHLVSCNTKR
ncbi:MAG: zf-HC2 domain-containing protein [Gemmatimonadaceae bacterium]